jgi:hypothetical protein
MNNPETSSTKITFFVKKFFLAAQRKIQAKIGRAVKNSSQKWPRSEKF